MNLEQRIERLERENRRLKLVGGALVAAVVAASPVGAAMPQDIPEVLEARMFRVVDAAGSQEDAGPFERLLVPPDELPPECELGPAPVLRPPANANPAISSEPSFVALLVLNFMFASTDEEEVQLEALRGNRAAQQQFLIERAGDFDAGYIAEYGTTPANKVYVRALRFNEDVNQQQRDQWLGRDLFPAPGAVQFATGSLVVVVAPNRPGSPCLEPVSAYFESLQ